MITTKDIKIQKITELTSEYIEQELNKQNIVPLRWAIVGESDNFYILSVSFEEIV